MNGWILGIGSAIPKNYVSQKDAFTALTKLVDCDENRFKYLQNLYENSGIIKRHMVLPAEFLYNYYSLNPGMGSRNDHYKRESLKLAEEASIKAVESWGGSVSDITHVISVSCTGVYAPGIEFSLIDSLKLNRSVLRFGINFMGCFGAFKGMQVAHAFAKQNPKARILVVCTELCSLHLQRTLDPDSLLSGSIFADGSSAIVVGAEPKQSEKPLWEILRERGHSLVDSQEQMTWEASDTGFRMKLSSFVPLKISHHIRPFVSDLMEGISPEACDWAIHPGGKSILQVLQRKLKLTDDQLKSTHDIFSNYGNMSSATVLFVLEKLLKMGARKQYCLGLGFGPGLSIEGFALRC